MKPLDSIDTGPMIRCPKGEVENFATHVFRFVAMGMDRLDDENRRKFLEELPQRTELLRTAIIAEAEGREAGYAFSEQVPVHYDNQRLSDQVFRWLDEAFEDEAGEVIQFTHR